MTSPPINLRQVHHFVALAKFQSYVRAAEELGLTQSALTRSIQALEQQFSVRLLDRDRAGVRLTPAGREILAEAEGLLYRADELAQKMIVSNTGAEGRVSVGFAPHSAVIIGSKIFSEIMAQYPRLDLCLEVLSIDPLLDMLYNNDIEIMVCSDHQIAPNTPVDLESLMDIRLAAHVRRGHPLAGRPEITRKDLQTFPLVSARWGSHLAKKGATRYGSPMVSCNDVRTLLEITADSDAVWVGPSMDWLSEGERAGLVELDMKPGEIVDQACLNIVTARRRTLSPQARLVCERIRDFCQRMSRPSLTKLATVRARAAVAIG